MSFTLLLFTLIALAAAGPAEARQQPDIPCWDVAASIGVLSANPEPTEPFAGDWYTEGRYALTVGRDWTEHLKTELEFATSTEGDRYSVRNANVPGVPQYFPISSRDHFQLNQVSGRLAWQFLDNTWVHPYVFGGVIVDIERRKTYTPEQIYHPDPRSQAGRIVVTPELRRGPEFVTRAGATAGAGAKIYMTPNAFFNAALIATYARPAQTVSLIGGFGVDF